MPMFPYRVTFAGCDVRRACALSRPRKTQPGKAFQSRVVRAAEVQRARAWQRVGFLCLKTSSLCLDLT